MPPAMTTPPVIPPAAVLSELRTNCPAPDFVNPPVPLRKFEIVTESIPNKAWFSTRIVRLTIPKLMEPAPVRR